MTVGVSPSLAADGESLNCRNDGLLIHLFICGNKETYLQVIKGSWQQLNFNKTLTRV